MLARRVILLLCLLVACGKTHAAEPLDLGEVPPSQLVFLERAAIVRKDAAGKTLWTHMVETPLGSGHPPDAVIGDRRVVVATDIGLLALDDASGGRQVWRALGGHRRLLASDGLVIGASGVEVVGRQIGDGTEVFRFAVPGMVEAQSIRKLGTRFMVMSGNGVNEIFDAGGEGRVRIDESITIAQPIDSDLIFAATRRIARVHLYEGNNVSGPVWEGPAPANGSIDGGGFVVVPGGDLVLFDYDRTSDSGVEVIRFHPWDGKEVYRVPCAPVGVAHSEYVHNATVRLDGRNLIVKSRGSYGSFDEVLDFATGAKLSRIERRR